MSEDRLKEIEARWRAATPGPWSWFGNTGCRAIYLATVHHGRRFIMNFVRWGMQSAQPRFQVNSVMRNAATMVEYEVEYRRDFHRVNHPDAIAIAAAPQDVAYLLAELRRAREALAPFAKMADLYDADPDPLPDTEGLVGHVTVGDFRRARAALGEEGQS